MSKLVLLSLAVLAHHQDNGDGSTSTILYNDRAHFLAVQAEDDDGFDEETPEEIFAKIESEDDPHRYGTFSNETIELELNTETNTVRLLKPIAMSSDG